MEVIKLVNKNFEIEFTNIGAAIKSLKFKGMDMVIRPDGEEFFNNNYSYQGAIVGPTAGRIANGEFELNGKTYHLQQNFLEKHNLHGSQLEQLKYEYTLEDNRIIFSRRYSDEYYECQLEIDVIYTLDDNALDLTINVTSDQDTIINMTNHAYFNLGFDDLILNHQLLIPSDYVWYLNEESLPVKKVVTKESILDFNSKIRIGDRLVAHEQFDKVRFIDHPFKLIGDNIKLLNPQNQVQLEISTNQDYVVIYTGNYLADENITMDGRPLRQFETICIETQALPNAINIDEERDKVILKAGKKYTNHTNYKFTQGEIYE